MFPYDTNEVQKDASDLLKKMTGRECPSSLSILTYVDDHDERGCKVIFQCAAQDVVTIGRMISAGVLNMGNVVNQVYESIRIQLGDEAAKEFLEALSNDVKESAGSGALKQVTELMVHPKDEGRAKS